MGAMFDSLTKTGVQDGGASPKFYDSPEQATSAASDALVKSKQPWALDSQTGQLSGGDYTQTPKVVKPTFKQATTDASGLPRTINPSETRLGQLVHVLKSAAEGGLAGRAADEQAVIQSGGHRSGGFGVGAQAAMTAPFQRAAMQNSAQRDAMQTQATKNQMDLASQPVTLPDGSKVPFAMYQRNLAIQKELAGINKDKFVTPRNGGVYNTDTGKFAPGTEPQDKTATQSPLQLYSESVKDAMGKGLTGDALLNDPTVQTSLRAYQAAQKGEKPDNLDQQYLDAATKGDTTTMGNIEKAWKAKATNVHINNPKAGSEEDYTYVANQLLDPYNLTALKDVAGRGGKERSHIFALTSKLAQERGQTFDPGIIDRRIKFLDSYEDPKGRPANNRQSMNNILMHGADLLDLNNQYRARSEFRPINTPINEIAKTFGSEAYTQFATLNSILKDEISLYFAGGYAPNKEQQGTWERIQADTATPAQTEAFAREIATAGLRRAATHNSDFKSMMGYDDPNLIIPDAAVAAGKLGLANEIKKFGSGGRVGRPNQAQGTSSAQPADGGWKVVNGIRVRAVQ